MSDTPYASALSEDLPFPLLQLAADDTIIWANTAAQAWFGQSLKKLLGMSVWDVLNIETTEQNITARARGNHSPLTIRDVVVRRSHQAGRGDLCHLTAYPNEAGLGLSVWVSGPHPRKVGFGGQAVSGMGRLIAHELKNPLAGIKGAAQLLRDDVASKEGLALIDLIGSEIDRIGRLAGRMERLGDVDPDDASSVNIHTLLRQARQVIQSANPDIIFTERYDPSLPHAQGHADSLMQAILNLIKNAAEATSGQGQIALETSFRSGVRGAEKTLPIQIRIIDNGPGISANLMDQLFQPFFTTKPEGQGLGLALVYKVASAHGGLVEVKSNPGRTIFSLLLPVPETSQPDASNFKTTDTFS